MGKGMAKTVESYRRHHGYDCHLDSAAGARMVGLDMSAGDCQNNCSADLQCSCAQYDRGARACYVGRISLCKENKCTRSQDTDIYLQKAKWGVDTKKLVRFAGKACAAEGGTVIDSTEHVELQSCRASCVG